MTTVRMERRGKKGTWWLIASLPGNRRLRRSLGTSDRHTAERRKAAMEQDLLSGVTPQPSMRVRDWLERWLDTERERGRAPTTLGTYRSYVDRYLLPRLGAVRLDALTVADVERFDADILRGGRQGGGTLAPRTVRAVHAMLAAALTDAQRADLLGRNVASLARQPAEPSDKPRWLSREEAGRLIAACPGHPWGAFVVVALRTGLRCGELCGLRWADVDLADGVLHVERQRRFSRGDGYKDAAPKSAAGVRDVPLTSDAVEWLRQLQERQAEASAALGVEGPQHVFAHRWHRHWAPYAPCSAPHGVASVYRAAGLNVPPNPIHALRHTTGRTLATVDPKVRSAILGHDDPQTTMHYTHPDQDDLRQAVHGSAKRLTKQEGN